MRVGASKLLTLPDELFHRENFRFGDVDEESGPAELQEVPSARTELGFRGCGGWRRLFRGRHLGAGNQFDRNQFGSIANPPPGLHHPGIASWTVLESRRYVAEELRDHGLASQKAESPSASRQGTVFTKRNHTIGKSPDFLRLGLGRFDPLMFEQRRDKTSEQGPAMLGLSAELSTFFSVTHGSLLFSLFDRLGITV